MENRYSRYTINSERDTFKNCLKGLSVIELCITELCTRKCSFCPRHNPDVYPNQKLFMSIDTMRNIGIKCKESNYECDFHISGFGESLTNKNFYKLVTELRSHLPDNRIALTSNGDLLTVDVIKQIYDSGVTYMIISCYDGPEHKTKFEKMFTENGIEDYEIRELWFNPDETTEDLMNRNNFNNRSGAVDFEHLQGEVYVERPCNLPFYKLVLDWDGSALLCCNDWFRRHKGFGNINNNTLEEIWFGSEFTNVREMLSKGDRSGSACKYCNIEGTMVGEASVNLLMNK